MIPAHPMPAPTALHAEAKLPEGKKAAVQVRVEEITVTSQKNGVKEKKTKIQAVVTATLTELGLTGKGQAKVIVTTGKNNDNGKKITYKKISPEANKKVTDKLTQTAEKAIDTFRRELTHKKKELANKNHFKHAPKPKNTHTHSPAETTSTVKKN